MSRPSPSGWVSDRIASSPMVSAPSATKSGSLKVAAARTAQGSSSEVRPISFCTAAGLVTGGSRVGLEAMR